MKKTLIITAVVLLLAACAPVLNKDLMREGRRNASLDELKANPAAYKGKLFILGGLIVETRLIEKGSQVEVLSVPVDSRGYLEDSGAGGRFLALYPQSKGLLDPLVFKKGREVTLAGEFLRDEKGEDRRAGVCLSGVRHQAGLSLGRPDAILQRVSLPRLLPLSLLVRPALVGPLAATGVVVTKQ